MLTAAGTTLATTTAALATLTTRPAWHAGTAAAHLTARTGLTAWRTGAAGPLRAVLVRGYFAVLVLVEFLQRLAGLGEFVGVNRAVPVQIERFDDRIHWALAAHAAHAAGTAALSAGTTRAALTSRRALPFRALIAVLRVEKTRRSTECQREEEDLCFHDVFCVYRVCPAPAVCIDPTQSRVRLERRKSCRPASTGVALKSESSLASLELELPPAGSARGNRPPAPEWMGFPSYCSWCILDTCCALAVSRPAPKFTAASIHLFIFTVPTYAKEP